MNSAYAVIYLPLELRDFLCHETDPLDHLPAYKINTFNAGDGDEYTSIARKRLLILYSSLLRDKDVLAKASDIRNCFGKRKSSSQSELALVVDFLLVLYYLLPTSTTSDWLLLFRFSVKREVITKCHIMGGCVEQHMYTEPPTVAWPRQEQPCPIAGDFCMNGGTCLFFETVGEPACNRWIITFLIRENYFEIQFSSSLKFNFNAISEIPCARLNEVSRNVCCRLLEKSRLLIVDGKREV
ncbi:hypothetical protein ALC62_12763 [Cyphomyrmex costatus]|uniref:Uncharacterized protein n=1 Tax=Cyphomyrmex costatus TaxID=456900 RepID=A0A151IAQ8_9HYME|nr:hypothetical protein ALC62_12763 [Cyphomyrmex costatus]